MGFTHVEFMPVAEHAYYPSWGYQVTGFYAPTSRYGTPEDFQYLVNALHEAGMGVIIDWVPAHFPRDDWALARFDGTALYEHEDPRKGAHQDWGTLDLQLRAARGGELPAGQRAVLVRPLPHGRPAGGCGGLDALPGLLAAAGRSGFPTSSAGARTWRPSSSSAASTTSRTPSIPGVMTIAEESTAWPQVTRPPYLGGLGFSFKWNMGWMHDTLLYFSHDPVHRKYHQNDLTFAMLYHYHENFILPLSHDEVVHGKGSLLGRMPGDDWRQVREPADAAGLPMAVPGQEAAVHGRRIRPVARNGTPTPS